ncbi:crotonobetainyl-CoA:carnitine CoA-transferase CaiB-like acyl-CoA transferase [Bradyrhizobium sp. LB9.1b]
MTEAASSGAATGAMSGLRVIDLTRVLGGPYCTQILADHGADVIKVEPPAGDEVRDWGPPFHEEDAAYFIGINRNKRSIGLDLASEGGRLVLLKMLESADVLIENFKPGTLEKWGIGSEVLREKFPRLVHCRICGFGADGPRGGNPGYDAIIQAMTGMIAATGSPESGPMRIGVPLVDIGTGLYAAIGILMALSERQRSGQGQFLETTLYETGLAIMHPHTANYFMHGKPPSLTGNEHPNLVPYAIFPTKTDDIFIGVGNDGTFRKLAKEIGKPELGTDPRFARNKDRIANREALRAELAAVFSAPARGRAAVQSPPRRGPARRPRAEDRPGADQPAHDRPRRYHREGLVQGRGVADPARSQQAEPAQPAAEIQPALGRGAGRVRLLQVRDQRDGRAGHGLRPRAQALRRDAIELTTRRKKGALPRPLAGEGWGEGASAVRLPKRREPSPGALRRPLPQAGEVGARGPSVCLALFC